MRIPLITETILATGKDYSATDARRLTRTICLRKKDVCVFLCGSVANLIAYEQDQRKKGLRRILVRLQGAPKDKSAVAD